MRIRTKIIGLVAVALFGTYAVCGTFAVNQYMNVSVEKLAAMETEKLQLAQQVFSQIGTREELKKMGETARDAYLKYQFERCYQKGYALLKGQICIKNMTDYDISAPEALGEKYVVQELGERYLLIMKKRLPYPQDFYVLSVKDITSTWEEARGQAAGFLCQRWSICPGISDGASQNGEREDLSASRLTEDDRKKIQADVEKKAENLLQKMGLEDFCLEETRWRRLAVSRNSSWSPSGEQGIRLYYWRSVEDMPIIRRGKKYNSRSDQAQYIEFLYKEDGALLAVKNIGRERVTGISEYAESLLPFLEVSQIFEQCMKTAETDGDIGVAEVEAHVPAQRTPVLTETHPGIKPHIYLTITEVKLVYRTEYGNQDSEEFQKNGEKGKAVPVWAFYGITERGYENPDGTEAEIPRTLLSGGQTRLLMVNAEDGTIYWR